MKKLLKRNSKHDYYNFVEVPISGSAYRIVV